MKKSDFWFVALVGAFIADACSGWNMYINIIVILLAIILLADTAVRCRRLFKNGRNKA